MKSIQEAIHLIESTGVEKELVEIDLLDALGSVLAEDVLSPIDLPPFSQSAMDGYAVCGEGGRYELLGETKAGDEMFEKELKAGQAIRIFTGAMIPKGATSIAKQEIVELDSGGIFLTEELKKGTSIRIQGEELAQGSVALYKGTEINSASIGLLSGIGVSKVKVWRKPRVGIVVSGNELSSLGEDLEPGKIYESNSYTLRASLQSIGLTGEVERIPDQFEETVKMISHQLDKNDFVLITGGISVGDYDFVKDALDQIGVKQIFYKLNQKPGKPIFYGEIGNKRVFALPGNPAAVLTCFYMYVQPALNIMRGRKQSFLQKTKAVLTEDFIKKGSRGFLLKGILEEGKVSVSRGQSSAMLSSFVDANCLIHIEGESRKVEAGTMVDVYIIR
ncbi:MAG: molybdopterin molybdotransferase MoeA [Crocinitomicaceae bacterium]